MKIYIASSEKYKGKITEDTYMRDAYTRMGYCCEILTLKDIVRLSKPSDVVILKSIWGYYLNHLGFLRQIDNLRRKNVKLINDYEYILWNIDKYKYLDEIKNLSIIPTVLLKLKTAKTEYEIKNIFLEAGMKLNANILVIKPCISESGYLTFKYDIDGDNASILSLLRNIKYIELIAQPYRSSISEGEISVIMINGTILYGIKRFSGVFYQKLDSVYVELNGVPYVLLRMVTSLKIFFSERFGKLPTICRVDFLKFGIKYEILEVELIDPDLFLRSIPESMKETVVRMIYKTFNNKTYV